MKGFSDYMNDKVILTIIEEDYLKLIYQFCIKNESTNLYQIANHFKVDANTAYEIIKKLDTKSFISYDNGIELTEKGYVIGEYLYEKHYIVENFLKILSVKENLEIDTNNIANIISDETFENIKKLVIFFHDYQQIKIFFDDYINYK